MYIHIKISAKLKMELINVHLHLMYTSSIDNQSTVGSQKCVLIHVEADRF